jgi:hypothetical protein
MEEKSASSTRFQPSFTYAPKLERKPADSTTLSPHRNLRAGKSNSTSRDTVFFNNSTSSDLFKDMPQRQETTEFEAKLRYMVFGANPLTLLHPSLKCIQRFANLQLMVVECMPVAVHRDLINSHLVTTLSFVRVRNNQVGDMLAHNPGLKWENLPEV